MLKTAEAVSPLHPDKMCDRISDALVDYFLARDPESRCAIEVMAGHGKIFIAGEVTALCVWPTDEEVGEIIAKIVPSKTAEFEIKISIVKQSPEIAQGVDTGGAGDQGIVVGYACRENPALIPLEHYLARKLCAFIYSTYPADGKTQITIDANNKIQTIVASWQGVPAVELEEIVRRWMRTPAIGGEENAHPEILCNPAGDWDTGGFDADAGLTGRKIVCDAYGPRVPVGGGAFSGKDGTKVDRSGAYRARQLAIEILIGSVEHREVTIRAAYAIGKSAPVQIVAEIIKAGSLPIVKDITSQFDQTFTPEFMISTLGLKNPIFEKTTEWGAFGNPALPWEKI